MEKNAESLPPVDGGKHAWVFLASAFMVEWVPLATLLGFKEG